MFFQRSIEKAKDAEAVYQRSIFTSSDAVAASIVKSRKASDKFIYQDSGFYNLLEFGDEVMAERDFQVREDLLHHYCKLSIPPGARVKSQMTASEFRKTKEVANLRIHVEHAISRINTFRILKNTLTLTMLLYADDIIRTYAAISSIQPPLIK